MCLQLKTTNISITLKTTSVKFSFKFSVDFSWDLYMRYVKVTFFLFIFIFLKKMDYKCEFYQNHFDSLDALKNHWKAYIKKAYNDIVAVL